MDVESAASAYLPFALNIKCKALGLYNVLENIMTTLYLILRKDIGSRPYMIQLMQVHSRTIINRVSRSVNDRKKRWSPNPISKVVAFGVLIIQKTTVKASLLLQKVKAGPYIFKIEAVVTVNGERYRALINDFIVLVGDQQVSAIYSQSNNQIVEVNFG